MDGMTGLSHAGAGTTVSLNALLAQRERQRGRPSGWGKPQRGPREPRTKTGPGNIEADFRRASVRRQGSPAMPQHMNQGRARRNSLPRTLTAITPVRAAVCLALYGVVPAVQAQEAASAEGSVLQEVTVTATRRSEALEA